MVKVLDIIAALSDFDPEDEVLVVDSDGGTYDISDFESDGPFVVIEVVYND